MGRFATEAAEAAFAALAERFEGELTRGVMMGRRILKRDGRMIACVDGDGLGIRLGAGSGAFTAAMALPGAALFGPGRSAGFRDWVSLPVALADRWDEFVELA